MKHVHPKKKPKHKGAQVSKHSATRAKERAGIQKGQVDKHANRALQYGFKVTDCCGDLQQRMKEIYQKQYIANNTRIYNGMYWLFNGNELITVYPLEDNIQKELWKYITSPKKYLDYIHEKARLKGLNSHFDMLYKAFENLDIETVLRDFFAQGYMHYFGRIWTHPTNRSVDIETHNTYCPMAHQRAVRNYMREQYGIRVDFSHNAELPLPTKVNIKRMRRMALKQAKPICVELLDTPVIRDEHLSFKEPTEVSIELLVNRSDMYPGAGKWVVIL